MVRGGRVGWKFCLRGGLAGMPAVNAHNSIPLSCACAARQCSGVRSFLGRRGRFFLSRRLCLMMWMEPLSLIIAHN